VNFKDPMVSVSMITFKHEKFIRQAVESVLMQKTDFEYDLVICDDCSPDNTKQIVNEIIASSEKKHIIKYFRHPENIGMIKNGIFSLSNCSGKYIALCEGDDYWTDPFKLQKQVDFMEANSEYGLIWSDIDIYSQSEGTFKRSVFKNNILTIYNSFTDTLINKPFFAPPTWLFRREFMLLDMPEYCDGTFPMILEILANSRIKYMDEVTATYRQLDESASNSLSALKRYNFLNGVYRIQKEYINKYQLSSRIQEEIDLKHFKAAYPYAVFLEDKLMIEKGKQFLKDYSHQDMKIRVMLFLSNYYLGIILLRIIYNYNPLKKLIARLSMFR
jgi:glycosyltransferase involved in cell wall biosynthesis